MRMSLLILKIKNLVLRSLMVMILFLFLAILCKKNTLYKDYIYEKIYNTNISFSLFRNVYNKYLGGIFPGFNIDKVEAVFEEDFKYSEILDYKDGAKVVVADDYLVPVLYEGVVVYVGEKEAYGNVIILENNLGVDTWYGNICNSTVSLYDTLEVGSYIGQSCNNYIYLVFSNRNDFLDYSDFLG